MSNTLTCPFCLPAVSPAVFAETKNFKAIYNLAPILPGHSLIIPKKHVSSFMDISDEYMNEMIVFSRKVIRTLQHAFHTTSFDWTIQEGVEAGQTVDHMHLHIIPRKTNDLPNCGDWYPLLEESISKLSESTSRPRHTDEEMKVIATRLGSIFESK